MRRIALEIFGRIWSHVNEKRKKSLKKVENKKKSPGYGGEVHIHMLPPLKTVKAYAEVSGLRNVGSSGDNGKQS